VSTIPEIKARLQQPGTPFTYVRGATALSQVKDKPEGIGPWAFVLATKEVSAETSRATGKVMQRQERDVMVVIVVENLGDPDGDAVIDPLEGLKTFVRDQLIGFKPTDMNSVITHVEGEVVEAVSGCVWFQDTFSAPIYLTEKT
jgi:hypothetical protein